MTTLQVNLQQPSLLDICPVTAAVEALAGAGSVEARGAVYTRVEVVQFILDLARYTPDRPLHNLTLLEPSCGAGDFLLPAVDRLLQAWREAGSPGPVCEVLRFCIRAVELHRESFNRVSAALHRRLLEGGIEEAHADALRKSWLVHGDFLLTEWPGEFDVVVGNPPYVRQEMIPAPLLAEYRSRYSTLYDRADLYVPFIERCLKLLRPGGVLGFICADRWMKNRYGGPLRTLVSRGYWLKVHVDMTDTPAFLTEVTAYPAISVIARESPGPTRIATRPHVDRQYLAQLAERLMSAEPPAFQGDVRELAEVANGDQPWVLDKASHIELVRELEHRFPSLEAAGCKVGIGVATGADQAFIAPFDTLDVEPGRKLPLVTTRDINSGEVDWHGLGVVNPFEDDGALVDLSQYPKLRGYLEARRQQIEGRHVAMKAPRNWYRTIDRIWPALARRPKLLIPDIKGESHVVYEEGRLYPHHNLYYVVSDEWDLHALQAVLLSDVAKLFVATYSTRMRGGFLRFQAQYLRRIRLPHWGDVAPAMRERLASAARSLDRDACNAAALELFGLGSRHRAHLEEALAVQDQR